MRKPALLISAAFHALAILLLVVAAALAPHALPPPHPIVIELAPRLNAPPRARPTEGGGSRRAPLVARQERGPERPAARVFLPPAIVADRQPKLVNLAALPEAPEPAVSLAGIGGLPGVSSGFGRLGGGLPGVGNGLGRGAGDGSGDGFGNGEALPARITRQPELVHKEEPEYSEQARQAHFQGVVKLRIDVGLDGLATNIQVIESAGLGLDEKAIEAVRRWRFRPALAGGRPVTAPALIEVGFHLL